MNQNKFFSVSIFISLLSISCVGLACNKIEEKTSLDNNIENKVLADIQIESSSSTPQGQFLDIGAKAIISGKSIDLEVAKSDREQSLGLMYREELPGDRGMFFPFREPRITRFWMKNVPVSLDMIFLREGKVVFISHNVPPCEDYVEVCPLYGPDTLVDGVIELRSGRAKELQISIGDDIAINFLN